MKKIKSEFKSALEMMKYLAIPCSRREADFLNDRNLTYTFYHEYQAENVSNDFTLSGIIHSRKKNEIIVSESQLCKDLWHAVE